MRKDFGLAAATFLLLIAALKADAIEDVLSGQNDRMRETTIYNYDAGRSVTWRDFKEYDREGDMLIFSQEGKDDVYLRVGHLLPVNFKEIAVPFLETGDIKSNTPVFE